MLERSVTQTLPSPPQFRNSSRYVVESPPNSPMIRTNLRLAASVPCNLNQLAVPSTQLVLFGPPPPGSSSLATFRDQQAISLGASSDNVDVETGRARITSTSSNTFVSTSVVPAPISRHASLATNVSSSSGGGELDEDDDDDDDERSQSPVRFASHAPLHSSRSYPLQSSPFQSTLRHSPLYSYRHSALHQYRRNNTWTPTSTQILAQRPLTSLTNNVTSGSRSLSNSSLNTITSSSNTCSYTTTTTAAPATTSSSSSSGGAVIQLRGDRRLSLPHVCVSVQRLDLQRQNPDDADAVRGQIVISLISRDRGGAVSSQQSTDSSQPAPAIPYDPNELPEG